MANTRLKIPFFGLKAQRTQLGFCVRTILHMEDTHNIKQSNPKSLRLS